MARHATKRQELVWRIAEKTLSPRDLFKISMIMTMTPDQLQVMD